MALQNISPVIFESVSAVTATNSVELGSRRMDANGYEYVYCYNACNSQISPGYGVQVATGTSGYSVTLTSVAEAPADFVGVVQHATLTTGDYGWIMTKGYGNLECSTQSTLTGPLYIVLVANGAFGAASAAITVPDRIVGVSDADADTASAGSFLGKIFSNF